MILEFIEALDIGYIGKQRFLIRVKNTGNLAGYHLMHGPQHLFAFPNFQVAEGDIIIVYLKDGEQASQKFPDGNCHFFYCAKWLRFWEESTDDFQIITLFRYVP